MTVNGLCFYYTILFIILDHTCLIFFKSWPQNSMLSYTSNSLIHVYHVLIASFALAIDLISRYFEQQHAVQPYRQGAIGYTTNFQPFSSQGTHKLITKIPQHTKNIIFTDLTKIRYNFDSFISDSYFVLAAVIFFLFDNLREKRSVPLTIQSGIGCFKNSCGTPFENPWAIPFGSGVQQAIPSRFV